MDVRRPSTPKGGLRQQFKILDLFGIVKVKHTK
jgi:hypothetical protein